MVLRLFAFDSAQAATRWLSEVETQWLSEVENRWLSEVETTVFFVSLMLFSTPTLVLLDSRSYASPYPLPILSL